MKNPRSPHQRWFVRRKALSAAVWLAVPSLTLLAFGSSRWKAYFRAQPFNLSYDAMFIAATAGLGLTPLWILLPYYRALRNQTTRTVPAFCSWRNAFDLFELFASAALAVVYVAAGAPGSGLFWSVSFVLLVMSSWSLSRAEKGVEVERRSDPTRLSRTASAFLVVVALLFIGFPVLQPWSGPPEPFVRWHPFSPAGELVWRGLFLSFAVGMILAAFDPLGRHRAFLVALVLSGYLHAGEMAADSLLSARMDGMNANPEHLYGDVLGWFLIASVSVLFLVLSRRSARHSRGGDTHSAAPQT